MTYSVTTLGAIYGTGDQSTREPERLQQRLNDMEASGFMLHTIVPDHRDAYGNPVSALVVFHRP